MYLFVCSLRSFSSIFSSSPLFFANRDCLHQLCYLVRNVLNIKHWKKRTKSPVRAKLKNILSLLLVDLDSFTFLMCWITYFAIMQHYLTVTLSLSLSLSMCQYRPNLIPFAKNQFRNLKDEDVFRCVWITEKVVANQRQHVTRKKRTMICEEPKSFQC